MRDFAVAGLPGLHSLPVTPYYYRREGYDLQQVFCSLDYRGIGTMEGDTGDMSRQLKVRGDMPCICTLSHTYNAHTITT